MRNLKPIAQLSAVSDINMYDFMGNLKKNHVHINDTLCLWRRYEPSGEEISKTLVLPCEGNYAKQLKLIEEAGRIFFVAA